jgi:hypothetical protein
VSEVVVGEVIGLKHRLVLQFGLNCKLQDRQHGFLPHVRPNFPFEVLSQIVHGVVLHVHAAARTPTTLLHEDLIHIVN